MKRHFLKLKGGGGWRDRAGGGGWVMKHNHAAYLRSDICAVSIGLPLQFALYFPRNLIGIRKQKQEPIFIDTKQGGDNLRKIRSPDQTGHFSSTSLFLHSLRTGVVPTCKNRYNS